MLATNVFGKHELFGNIYSGKYALKKVVKQFHQKEMRKLLQLFNELI